MGCGLLKTQSEFPNFYDSYRKSEARGSGARRSGVVGSDRGSGPGEARRGRGSGLGARIRATENP